MNKYKIPPTSAEFAAYTPEQLMLEFLEDVYDNDKEMFARMSTSDEGDVILPVFTGDPVIDELERRLAAGEDLTLEDLEVLEPKPPEGVKQKQNDTDDADSILDDYTDLSAPQP